MICEEYTLDEWLALPGEPSPICLAESIVHALRQPCPDSERRVRRRADRPHLDPDERREAVRRLHAAGLTITAIAREVRAGKSTVRRHLEEIGCETAPARPGNGDRADHPAMSQV